MSEPYYFGDDDLVLLEAAKALLQKTVASGDLRPAEVVSVAKLQHVLSRLPNVTSGLDVSVSVTSGRRTFGEIETWHSWRVEFGEETLSISSGGVYVGPNGSDSFTTMSWAAVAGIPAELNDYLPTLRMVPDVQSFPDAVAGINFASGSYGVEVSDDDNPLLEEDQEEDDEDGERPDNRESEDDADEGAHEPLIVTPRMSFKPDYGLQLLNSGVGRDVDQFFHNFRLYSLAVLGFGQYSTVVDFPLDGELYALSVDFNQQHLEQILAAAPPEIAEHIRGKLSQDPASCRTINFTGEVAFGLRARLGQVETAQNERFVPLIVQEIL
jgi:hypothetical protein